MLFALTRTSLFSLESTHTYRWSMELDQHQVHRLFTTFSDWSPAEVGACSQRRGRPRRTGH